MSAPFPGNLPPRGIQTHLAAGTTVRRPRSNHRLIALVVGGLALITAMAVVLGLALAGRTGGGPAEPPQLTQTPATPQGEPVGLPHGVVFHLSPGWEIKESRDGRVVLTDPDGNLIVFSAETGVAPTDRVTQLTEESFLGASEVSIEPTGPITTREGFPSATTHGEGSVTGAGGSGRVTVHAAAVQRSADGVSLSGALIAPTRRYSESLQAQFTQMLNTGYVNLQQT